MNIAAIAANQWHRPQPCYVQFRAVPIHRDHRNNEQTGLRAPAIVTRPFLGAATLCVLRDLSVKIVVVVLRALCGSSLRRGLPSYLRHPRNPRSGPFSANSAPPRDNYPSSLSWCGGVLVVKIPAVALCVLCILCGSNPRRVVVDDADRGDVLTGKSPLSAKFAVYFPALIK